MAEPRRILPLECPRFGATELGSGCGLALPNALNGSGRVRGVFAEGGKR
jgi:hypothetical protein